MVLYYAFEPSGLRLLSLTVDRESRAVARIKMMRLIEMKKYRMSGSLLLDPLWAQMPNLYLFGELYVVLI